MVVFYVSGHGLGHASRQIEIINAIRKRRRGIRIVIRTSAPRWFFEASAAAAIEVQTAQVDTGVVQIDSLTLDEDETARRAVEFYATFEARVRDEAALLTELGAHLVVGDMPPLAFAAAHRAAVPSLAIGNFTWDWIYSGYPQFEQLAPGVIDRVADAYSHATRALRLPMHGGFETMRQVADIPLVARHASASRDSTRRTLGIARNGIVVLASFGGYGLDLAFEEIARLNPRLTLVVTSQELARRACTSSSPSVGSGSSRSLSTVGSGFSRIASGNDPRNLIIARDLPYPDLVAAADVVVTKPGYGIVSECVANRSALLYTDRGRFAEHDVMVSEMPRLLRCRFIPKQDLLAGTWTAAIDALLAQPAPRDQVATDGADRAATAITEILDLRV